jgi:beta-lactamase class C
LPNFSLNAPKNSDSLKIKHVLSHSSGLPRSGFDHLIETFAPHSKLIRMLQTTRITAPIGKRHDYHNAMFSLINEIILAATRHSFQDCLSTYLLKPLNMNSTSATYAALLANPNRAFPHIQSTKNKMTPAGTYSTGYYSVAPAGGINSSIRDMAIFLKAQLGGYPAIINQNVLARLHEPLVPTPSKSLSVVNGTRDKIKNSSYGLGWRLIDFNQKKMVYHAGWVKGFKNFIAFIPEEQVGIVVLHNSEIKFSPRLAMQFFDIFFSAF